MANFNITGDTTAVTGTTSLALNSAAFTGVLPLVNPTGATPATPKYLGFTDNTGTMSIITGGGGGGAADFNAINIHIATASATLTVADLAPGLVGPVSAEVIMIGGGGGGASITANGVAAATGGGGAGATAINYFNGLNAASSFTVTIGTGGLGGHNGGATTGIGSDGTATLVAYGTNIYGAYGGSGAGKNATAADDQNLAQAGLGGAAGIPTGGNTASAITVSGNAGGTGWNGNGPNVLAGGFGGAGFIGALQEGPFASSGGVAGFTGNSYGSGGTGIVKFDNSGDEHIGGQGASGAVIFRLFGVQS